LELGGRSGGERSSKGGGGGRGCEERVVAGAAGGCGACVAGAGGGATRRFLSANLISVVRAPAVCRSDQPLRAWAPILPIPAEFLWCRSLRKVRVLEVGEYQTMGKSYWGRVTSGAVLLVTSCQLDGVPSGFSARMWSGPNMLEIWSRVAEGQVLDFGLNPIASPGAAGEL
jgi:hypothetical protein